MSDEREKKRKEYEDDESPDVEAHGSVFEEAVGDDPERKRKRKRKQSEEAEIGELGRRRK